MQTVVPQSTRDRLIQAGLELLQDGGVQGLTWRKTAARAHVSHTAPAHYFTALPQLLTAIATRSFELFSEAVEQARDAAGPDPRARLHGICHGYLDFAAQHAGLFHVMFTESTVDRCDPEFMRASQNAYRLLHDGCAPFAAPDDLAMLEFAIWTSVHGYAMLGLADPVAARREVIPAIPPFDVLLEKMLANRA